MEEHNSALLRALVDLETYKYKAPPISQMSNL